MNKVTTVLIFCLLLTACGPGQVFGPTFTPTPTNTPTSTPTLTPTVTPTNTPSPTATFTPTITPSPTPNTSCLVKNGKWESNEVSTGYAPGPLLTFVVKNCQVTQVDSWLFPAPGELFWVQLSPISIVGNAFKHDETSDLGTYTFKGTFDSETSAHGTFFFPKGFLVVDYILPNDVTINWTAHPVQ
jgi:hypothetical protein